MILAVDPVTIKVALTVANKLKDKWPHVLLLCLVVVLLPFFLVTVVVGTFSWTSWSSEDPVKIAPYERVATNYSSWGLRWEDLLAVDLGYNLYESDKLPKIDLIRDAFVYEYQSCSTDDDGSESCSYEVIVRTFYDAMNYLNMNPEQRELAIQARQLLQETVSEGSDDNINFKLTDFTPCEGIYRLTSLYSKRIDPILNIERFHKGIDIGCPMNTNVLSYQDGVVSIIGYEENGYGNWLEVNSFGIATRYAHLNSVGVKKGDKITRGQVIAKSGNTGGSTGPHLHFEVWKGGVTVDPLTVLKTVKLQ